MKIIVLLLSITAYIICKIKIGNVNTGEKIVRKRLSKLNKNKFFVLNDILLKENNITSQIDHIVISEKAIFVIETKDYKGSIYGYENDEYWQQNIKGKVYNFKNPIRQNYGHIKAIKEKLHNKNIDIISIVVFTKRAKLCVNTNNIVITPRSIKKVIKKYKGTKESYIDSEKIYNTLKEYNITSRKNNKKHILNINKNLRIRNKLINKGICPKCSGELKKKKIYGKLYKVCRRCDFKMRIE